MTLELTLLVWSTALFGLYIGVQSTLYRMQHGVVFAATGRDHEPPPNPLSARSEKALRNLIETYPVFVVLVVASVLADRSDALTQWGALTYFVARIAYLPLYLAGVKYLRSLVWSVSALGLVLLFIGVAF
ncbi:MAG: MAPEG family protein [Devosia sp.]|nr:MAPEG family protein [Devosia sp.]